MVHSALQKYRQKENKQSYMKARLGVLILVIQTKHSWLLSVDTKAMISVKQHSNLNSNAQIGFTYSSSTEF